jgi:hypothetical protein
LPLFLFVSFSDSRNSRIFFFTYLVLSCRITIEVERASVEQILRKGSVLPYGYFGRALAFSFAGVLFVFLAEASSHAPAAGGNAGHMLFFCWLCMAGMFFVGLAGFSAATIRATKNRE